MERSAGRGSERLEEALGLEVDVGHRGGCQAGDREIARNGLFKTLSDLPTTPRSPVGDALVVSASLQLSALGVVMGKGFADLTDLLQNAPSAAERLEVCRSTLQDSLRSMRPFPERTSLEGLAVRSGPVIIAAPGSSVTGAAGASGVVCQ